MRCEVASWPPNNPGPRPQAPGTRHQAPGPRPEARGPRPQAPMPQSPMAHPLKRPLVDVPGEAPGPNPQWRIYVSGPSSTHLVYEAQMKVQKVCSAVVDEAETRTTVSVRFDRTEMKEEVKEEASCEQLAHAWVEDRFGSNLSDVSLKMPQTLDCSNGWHTCGADRNSCKNPYCVRRRGYARQASRCIDEYAHLVRVHYGVKLERDRLKALKTLKEKADKDREAGEKEKTTVKEEGRLALGKDGDRLCGSANASAKDMNDCITTQRSASR